MSSKTRIGFCRWFQELVSIYSSDDIILNLLQALIAMTKKEKTNDSFGWLKKAIKQRLEIIHEIKSICTFDYTDEMTQTEMKSGAFDPRHIF